MWVLTPSGAVAWPLDGGGYVAAEPGGPVAPPQGGAVSPYVDPETGTILSLSRHGKGAVALKALAGTLEVTKLLTPAGTFDLRIATPDDAVRLVASRNRLSISRGGRKAVLDTDAVDDLALQRIQVVLAGSGAVRQFRQIYASMGAETKARPEGLALGIVEAMLGWLQGDVDAIRRARPHAADPGGPTAAAMEGGDEEKPSCYKVWEQEVNDAWNDYEECVKSFDWWNPLREVCAFLWVIRAESAWFTMLGCSAIPIKVEAP